MNYFYSYFYLIIDGKDFIYYQVVQVELWCLQEQFKSVWVFYCWC